MVSGQGYYFVICCPSLLVNCFPGKTSNRTTASTSLICRRKADFTQKTQVYVEQTINKQQLSRETKTEKTRNLGQSPT